MPLNCTPGPNGVWTRDALAPGPCTSAPAPATDAAKGAASSANSHAAIGRGNTGGSGSWISCIQREIVSRLSVSANDGVLWPLVCVRDDASIAKGEAAAISGFACTAGGVVVSEESGVE